MNAYTKLIRLKRAIASDYWAERLFSQLDYSLKIADILLSADSFQLKNPVKEPEEWGRGLLQGVDAQLERVASATASQHTVSKRLVTAVESSLTSFSDMLKKPTLHLAGHAHIDINWMWGWHETVSITLETFRSVLTLMKEYPGFTFSQSQALLYRIVEEYEPEMLPEIRRRIRQGRWELTASMWTEADMNMLNGESLARHLLYSKQYLQKLFSVGEEQFQVVYLPDSFGHGANVPEILANGGVRYYYHCRGASDQHIYRWKAQSGKSVLAYRETKWYNDPVHYGIFSTIPEFIRRYKYDKILAVYGVGDHGGGPTRRDLSRIRDMQTWPLAPTIKTGTYLDYFQELDELSDLPEICTERNVIFTGCYTSQSRIKRANKVAEKNLYQTELWQALLHLTGRDKGGVKRERREQQALSEAWKRTLVSQFHDILPGSGTVETREFALGEFQKSLADAISIRTSLYRRLVGASGPGKVKPTEPLDTAYGSGIGFGNERGMIAAVERGSGDKRRITLFNPLPFWRKVYPLITLWDWGLPGEETQFSLPDGKAVPSQLLNKGTDNYWHHLYSLFVLEVDMPPAAYQDILIFPRARSLPESEFHSYGVEGWLVEQVSHLILENQRIKVRFDRSTGRIISCIDKEKGRESIAPPGAGFEYLLEERDRKHMSSWIEGAFVGKIEADSVAFEEEQSLLNGEVQSFCTFRYTYGTSEVKASYRLTRDEPFLRCEVSLLWQEFGSDQTGIPRLWYRVPLAFSGEKVLSDGINSTILREPRSQDMVASTFSAALGETQGFMITSGDGYGYRFEGDALSLNLLRSSIDPDPAPEAGKHSFNFALMPFSSRDTSKNELICQSSSFLHELEWISRELSQGENLGQRSFFSIREGVLHLASLKRAESFDGIVLRLYDTEGADQQVELTLCGEIEDVCAGDIHEKPLAERDLRYTPVTLQSDRENEPAIIRYLHPAFATTTLLVRLKR